jgi:hypothetical protein
MGKRVGRLQQGFTKMAEPSQPIDPDLEQTLLNAIVQFRDWNGGGDEPKVLYRSRDYPISTIFERVIQHNDSVLASIESTLISMRIEPPLDLPGFTYAAAGRACLKEIATRKARYERTRETRD